MAAAAESEGNMTAAAAESDGCLDGRRVDERRGVGTRAGGPGYFAAVANHQVRHSSTVRCGYDHSSGPISMSSSLARMHTTPVCGVRGALSVWRNLFYLVCFFKYSTK